ncbi:MAG TPA: Gfo/Idh/MocA family oxidoreductase [Terriglobia bacterium]|nr:Gfo/Idh/MocA family oxidoreductase [Terriglobia bacterium]
MSDRRVSRRSFIMTSAATLTAGKVLAKTVSLKRLGYKSPNEKLNIAAIGAGGKGASDLEGCSSENIVALCDPDWKTAAKSFEKYPKAKQYKDFRQMLDRQKDIEAVTISTPDHNHAVAALWAMERGIHVYVQKPLTQNIHEARKLTEAARKYGVATQMGNQGHSGEGVRKLCEMVWAGEIGNVKEVHVWTNRPIWPQGIPNPLPKEPVPDTMDWDIWLGPAKVRDYNHDYAPFNWRGWYDFGCGALGDMACHICDPANWALQLRDPSSVECIKIDGRNDQTFPNKSIVKYEFPARGTMAPVTLYWYEGGELPPRPQGVGEDVKLGNGKNGSLFSGDKGIITAGEYGDDSRLLPDERMKDYKFPDPILTRSPGHYRDWLRACKGGEKACSNFDYSGPFTEWVLLGVIAQRVEGKLLWDSNKMRFTNNSKANQYISREYRKGWKV